LPRRRLLGVRCLRCGAGDEDWPPAMSVLSYPIQLPATATKQTHPLQSYPPPNRPFPTKSLVASLFPNLWLLTGCVPNLKQHAFGGAAEETADGPPSPFASIPLMIDDSSSPHVHPIIPQSRVHFCGCPGRRGLGLVGCICEKSGVQNKVKLGVSRVVGEGRGVEERTLSVPVDRPLHSQSGWEAEGGAGGGGREREGGRGGASAAVSGCSTTR